MDLFDAPARYFEMLPGLIARMWAVEIAASLAMIALVSIRIWNARLLAGGLVLASAGMGIVWLVGLLQHPRPPVAPPPAEVQVADEASVAQASHTRRRARRAPPPVNCIRVLTDPAQSTC